MATNDYQKYVARPLNPLILIYQMFLGGDSGIRVAPSFSGFMDLLYGWVEKGMPRPIEANNRRTHWSQRDPIAGYGVWTDETLKA